MMYMALLIFYAQVIRGDRLNRLDAFYLHHNYHPSGNAYRSTKPTAKETLPLKADKIKCWNSQGNHLKKDCPTTPQQNSSSQPKSYLSKEKQHNLIKSFHKRFQNMTSQVNEITISSEDDSFDDKLNQFFSEFDNMMTKDTNNMSS